jgi:squalene monooxygenase
MGNGFPILMYQIDEHKFRILMDIPNEVQQTFAQERGIVHYIKTTIIPRLPESVQPAVETALRNGRLRRMPNQWLQPKNSEVTGAILLGDAGNIRHPLTGGGMTVALLDTITLSKLLRKGNTLLSDTIAVLHAMHTFHRNRKFYSMSLNILAQALYALFTSGRYVSIFAYASPALLYLTV